MKLEDLVVIEIREMVFKGDENITKAHRSHLAPNSQ
jgi:hypothetical protein